MRVLLFLGCCSACAAVVPTPPTATVAPAVAVDLRPRFLALGLAPRAQGARPTCSIFTTVGAFEFAVANNLGHGERLSVEYSNWAANAATGRHDDGDFFHHALAGFETFGLCRDGLWPYAANFEAGAAPPTSALVDGGRLLGRLGERLQLQWIKPNDGVRGLSEAQFAAVLTMLQNGWPVAAGAGHSRLLVGYRADANTTAGGVFTTLDSGLGGFGEVPEQYVRSELYDAFAVTLTDPANGRSR